MDVAATIDELRTKGQVWIPASVPVRTQHRVARAVKREEPATLSWMGDPVTGIPAYGEPTPGTATRLYLPVAPSAMGAVTPPRR